MDKLNRGVNFRRRRRWKMQKKTTAAAAAAAAAAVGVDSDDCNVNRLITSQPPHLIGFIKHNVWRELTLLSSSFPYFPHLYLARFMLLLYVCICMPCMQVGEDNISSSGVAKG